VHPRLIFQQVSDFTVATQTDQKWMRVTAEREG